jgi:hypothetical protein
MSSASSGPSRAGGSAPGLPSNGQGRCVPKHSRKAVGRHDAALWSVAVDSAQRTGLRFAGTARSASWRRSRFEVVGRARRARGDSLRRSRRRDEVGPRLPCRAWTASAAATWRRPIRWSTRADIRPGYSTSTPVRPRSTADKFAAARRSAPGFPVIVIVPVVNPLRAAASRSHQTATLFPSLLSGPRAPRHSRSGRRVTSRARHAPV